MPNEACQSQNNLAVLLKIYKNTTTVHKQGRILVIIGRKQLGKPYVNCLNLFPSVNGRSNSSASTSSTGQPETAKQSSCNSEGGANSTMPWLQPERTAPNNGKRKKPYSKKKATTTGSAAVMKDVILLPNPRMKVVPRGRIREELYVRRFVSTAFNITNELKASLKISLHHYSQIN